MSIMIPSRLIEIVKDNKATRILTGFWDSIYDALIKGTEFRGIDVYLNASTTAPRIAWTPIKFDTEILDTDGWYDPATGRFLPNVEGKYFVTAGAGIDDLDDGEYMLVAPHISGVLTPKVGKNDASANAQIVAATTSGIIDLNGVDEYVDIRGYHNNAADQEFEGSSFYTTYFSAFLIK